MAFPYEAEIARAFGGFYGKGLVYQALKSVRWCFTDRTALAEAELEYEERTDPAIHVAFPAEQPLAGLHRSGELPHLDDDALDDPLEPRDRRPSRRDVRRSSRRTGATSSWPRSSRASWRRPPAGRAGRRVGDAAGHAPRRAAAIAIPSRPRARGELTPEEAARVVPRRARRPRHDGRRHGPRPHGPGPRRGRLPDRTARGPADPLARGRRGPLHDGREVPGQEGPRREPRDRRGPEGRGRARRARPEVPPRVPPLLALQEPGHLPRDGAVVRAPRRLPTTDVRAGRPRRDRAGEVDACLGRGSASPAWSRTGASGSSPGSAAGARRSRSSTRCGTASAPGVYPWSDAPAEQKKFFDARRRASSAPRAPTPGTRGPPTDFLPPGRRPARLRARRLPGRDRHPGRLVRLGRLAHGRAALGRVARARPPGRAAARPTSTSRATTSTAAGSSRRC